MVDTLATFGARYFYNCRIFCITLATLGARYFFSYNESYPHPGPRCLKLFFFSGRVEEGGGGGRGKGGGGRVEGEGKEGGL